VSDHLSQSTCLEILHPKTDERPNPSVEEHHLVGKLSTAEILLTEVIDLLHFFNFFKFSDFNKEPTNSLKMI